MTIEKDRGEDGPGNGMGGGLASLALEESEATIECKHPSRSTGNAVQAGQRWGQKRDRYGPLKGICRYKQVRRQRDL